MAPVCREHAPTVTGQRVSALSGFRRHRPTDEARYSSSATSALALGNCAASAEGLRGFPEKSEGLVTHPAGHDLRVDLVESAVAFAYVVQHLGLPTKRVDHR